MRTAAVKLSDIMRCPKRSLLVHYGDSLQVSSDGWWSEWADGRDLYKAVFAEDARCPFDGGDDGEDR